MIFALTFYKKNFYKTVPVLQIVGFLFAKQITGAD